MRKILPYALFVIILVPQPDRAIAQDSYESLVKREEICWAFLAENFPFFLKKMGTAGQRSIELMSDQSTVTEEEKALLPVLQKNVQICSSIKLEVFTQDQTMAPHIASQHFRDVDAIILELYSRRFTWGDAATAYQASIDRANQAEEAYRIALITKYREELNQRLSSRRNNSIQEPVEVKPFNCTVVGDILNCR